MKRWSEKIAFSFYFLNYDMDAKFEKEMESRKMTNKAYDLAKKYFENKMDKGGKSYIGHLERVSNAVYLEKERVVKDKSSILGQYYDKAYIVALLHDLLEDTDCTPEILEKEGFDSEIIEAVIAITRRKDEKYYFDFIERVNRNDIARLVKKYDLEDNMDIRRLISLENEDLERLKRYWYCWRYLQGKINSVSCNNIIHPDRLFR